MLADGCTFNFIDFEILDTAFINNYWIMYARVTVKPWFSILLPEDAFLCSMRQAEHREGQRCRTRANVRKWAGAVLSRSGIEPERAAGPSDSSAGAESAKTSAAQRQLMMADTPSFVTPSRGSCHRLENELRPQSVSQWLHRHLTLRKRPM